MPLVGDDAICIRRLDYSETSQILLLFTRAHGLLRVIAKGAHRRTRAGASKYDGGVDLLDRGSAVFIHTPEKELSTLTEWSQADGHAGLRRALRPLYLGLYAGELVSAVLEEQDAHPRLWELLAATLGALAEGGGEGVFLAFELSLLREAGVAPEWSACTICRRSAGNVGVGSGPATVFFSPGRGGLVCRSCAAPDRVEVDARLVRLSRLMVETPGEVPEAELSSVDVDPLHRLLAGHVQNVLGKRLRMPAALFYAGS